MHMISHATLVRTHELIVMFELEVACGFLTQLFWALSTDSKKIIYWEETLILRSPFS